MLSYETKDRLFCAAVVAVPCFIAIGLVALLMGAYQASVERSAWLDKNCKIVGEISSSSTVAIGVGSGGAVTVAPVFIAGKTGYQCNDGKTYWE